MVFDIRTLFNSVQVSIKARVVTSESGHRLHLDLSPFLTGLETRTRGPGVGIGTEWVETELEPVICRYFEFVLEQGKYL